MSFLYPIFIYLMLPVILILFYFLMTGSKESFAMFDKVVLDKLRMQSKSLSRNARYMLFLMSFIFMIFALAQPVLKDGEIVVEAKSADILVGIDISDSMRAEDRYPNRLDFAKAKAISLIKQAPHNRIGVLAFAKHDYIVSPLSFDHSSVAFLLSKVKTENITEKGTRLDSMLHSAVSMLEHAKQKNLLLLTDGGDSDDFSDEIAMAKENNLRLFIMGIGTGKGSPVRDTEGGFIKHKGNILISKLNPAIQSLATKTGGVYIESVLGDEDIKMMLEEIESISEKSTLKEEKIPQYIQLFYYPLAVAILFLFLALSSFPRNMGKNLVLFIALCTGFNDAKAGLLDFQKLQEAKEAYSAEDYNRSKDLYSEFAMNSPEAVYNLGNSLYKSGEYEQALKVYGELSEDQPELKAQALHNSGNAQVKLQQYQEALTSYEHALEIMEDKETRENYEAVKEFLDEQDQEKNQSEDQKSNQENKEKQDSDQNSEQQNSSQEKSEHKNKDNDKNRDQQKSDQQQKSSQSNGEDPTEHKNDDKQNSVNEAQEEKEQENKPEAKSSDPQREVSTQTEAKQEGAVNMKQMSDLEAKKWLKIMQQTQQGHLYKMREAEHDEDENEKPW